MSEIKVVTSVKEMGYLIERIIEGAEQYLHIISPYVKLDNQIRALLADKHVLNGLEIHLTYGKNSLDTETKGQLDSMTHIRTHFLKDLHAKCYLNEKMALVTSMNLYDYSMIKNLEMGVLVVRKQNWFGSFEDDDLYQTIRNQAVRIMNQSESAHAPEKSASVRRSRNPAPTKRAASRSPLQTVAVPGNGSCIQCGVKIDIDPTRPFCKDHWRYGNRRNNVDRELQFCHICTNDYPTTRRKPACKACWEKYKDVLEFPAA